MKYIVTLNSKNYEVEVEHGRAKIESPKAVHTQHPIPDFPQAQNASAATIATPPVDAGIAPSPVPSSAQAPVQNQMAGVHIKAPMQGTISEIKVELGQIIEKGDSLAVLEAMKMENEITAPCAGKIIYITTPIGKKVNANDTIIIIG